MAQLKDTIVTGTLDATGHVLAGSNMYMPIGKALIATTSDGTDLHLVKSDTNSNIYFGNGSYDGNVGSSNLIGKTVNIQSKGGVYISSVNAKLNYREYGVNKILWTGGYYMTENHTAILSESISAQPNGIILFWSRFVNGASENSRFHMTVIPKQFAASYSTAGVNCPIITHEGVVGSKYVYITDTTIKGHADNTKNGSVGNVTLSNSSFVLRNVIGF